MTMTTEDFLHIVFWYGDIVNCMYKMSVDSHQHCIVSCKVQSTHAHYEGAVFTLQCHYILLCTSSSLIPSFTLYRNTKKINYVNANNTHSSLTFNSLITFCNLIAGPIRIPNSCSSWGLVAVEHWDKENFLHQFLHLNTYKVHFLIDWTTKVSITPNVKYKQ